MSDRTARVVVFSLLGICVGGALLSLPGPQRAKGILPNTPNPPATIRVMGTVRDFHTVHDDFDVTPADGTGHRASNVLEALDASGKPVFNAGSDLSGPFDNRVAHWKFDDGSGSTVSDEMGLNDGTLQAGPTWSTGQDGGALAFNGTTSYVNIPSSPQMQVVGDITFTAWFKLDADFNASSPDTLVILEKFQDTEHDFHIALAGLDYNRPEVPKGAMVFKVENGPTSDYYRYIWTNQTSWSAGVWYHFGATLTSTDTSQNRLIINGADDTDPVNAGGIGFVDTSYDAPMRIGGRTVDYNGLATDIYFEGTIDDVMIFDRALTPLDFSPSPGGYVVATQWQDSSSQNIAPHLYAGTTAGSDVVNLVSAVQLNNSPVVDSYDSGVGPYGGANIGPAPTFESGATLPTITPPTGLPYQAIVTYDGNATSTLSADVHCDEFHVLNEHVLSISGDVRIVADTHFEIRNISQIELLPGATLEIYSNSVTDIRNNVGINVNTGDPTRVSIYHLGSAAALLENSVEVHANLFAPNATYTFQNTADLYGRYEGNGLILENTGAYHHDAQSLATLDVCGNTLSDVAGTPGAGSDGGITSSDTFDEWFDNHLGVNLSAGHEIQMTLNGSVYEYLDDGFHPIDGRLFGNESQIHNYNLTYDIGARFTYDACTGQFIEFTGGDGTWIFIDGQLVVDLGGVQSGQTQTIVLDRLDHLTDGAEHLVRIFYAQRNPTSAVFRLRTNIELGQPDDGTVVSAGFD